MNRGTSGLLPINTGNTRGDLELQVAAVQPASDTGLKFWRLRGLTRWHPLWETPRSWKLQFSPSIPISCTSFKISSWNARRQQTELIPYQNWKFSNKGTLFWNCVLLTRLIRWSKQILNPAQLKQTHRFHIISMPKYSHVKRGKKTPSKLCQNFSEENLNGNASISKDVKCPRPIFFLIIIIF